MDYIFVLVLGLLIGSFLNVCIYRIPREESIAYPPSHCTNCKNGIKPYDLIPVISYIFLKGKCRYCGQKISIRYPLTELFTGIIFVGIYGHYGLSIEFLKFAVLACFLIVIGIIDLDTTDIYFKTTISGVIIGVIFLFIYYFKGDSISTYILGALIGGGFISLIILLTGGMGWGDAEMCFLAGMYLGWKLTALMLFLSVILGAVIGVLLIITKKKSRKDYIPFGPYIAMGAMIAVFWGEEILRWYLL
ncbi:prepilin peptidase [Clostridium ganghwense]|uniref:Prepilin peptidase n=1 Tax=Clostridium ganghwense TaxID=312089 RepID=A0ABT4CPC6_9CLOT|nr:A24 family peptidase [Clostridium ganghwense]MCY6370905.1 prepilin peptidase [Clostridium ganghwense]